MLEVIDVAKYKEMDAEADSDWKEYYDDVSGRNYWVNQQTGESKWYNPELNYGKEDTFKPLRISFSASSESLEPVDDTELQWTEAIDIVLICLEPEDAYRMLKTLYTVVYNLQHPDLKFRQLFLSNTNLQEKLLKHAGGIDLLLRLGFVKEPESNKLFLSKELSPETLTSILNVITSKMKQSKSEIQKKNHMTYGFQEAEKEPKVWLRAIEGVMNNLNSEESCDMLRHFSFLLKYLKLKAPKQLRTSNSVLKDGLLRHNGGLDLVMMIGFSRENDRLVLKKPLSMEILELITDVVKLKKQECAAKVSKTLLPSTRSLKIFRGLSEASSEYVD